MSGLSKPRQRGPFKFKTRDSGRYKSAAHERSVAFNLTLDVQSLRQQVQDLTRTRDLLQWKALARSHTPDGSLFRTVREFYRLFRHGYCLEPTSLETADVWRRNVTWRQREFLLRVMADDIDIGNGFSGRDLMIDQMRMYAASLPSFSLDMTGFEIVQADDSVLITSHATFDFQITRTTIEIVFPHVVGNDQLLAQLVGQWITCEIHLTFCFNGDRKCIQYNVNTEFLKAFSALLKAPQDVELLMGRALITSNCMLGVKSDCRSRDFERVSTCSDAGQTPRQEILPSITRASLLAHLPDTDAEPSKLGKRGRS